MTGGATGCVHVKKKRGGGDLRGSGRSGGGCRNRRSMISRGAVDAGIASGGFIEGGREKGAGEHGGQKGRELAQPAEPR